MSEDLDFSPGDDEPATGPHSAQLMFSATWMTELQKTSGNSSRCINDISWICP